MIRTHLEQLHTTYGVTDIVADSALYREANLQKLAQTAMKWITRVPATLSEAQAALAQVDPQALAPLQEGYRSHELTSTDGGIAQRWVLIYSEPRQPQAQRTIDRQRRQQREAEVKALKKLCRSTFACEADARQALCDLRTGLAGHMSECQLDDARRRAMAHGDAPATGLNPSSWSTRSTAPWPPRSRPDKPASTSRVVSSSPPTHLTPPNCRRKRCWQATGVRSMWNVGSAF